MQQMGAMRDDYDRTRPTDVQGALRRGSDQILANIENNTELLRVMFREPEALDDMIDDVWHRHRPIPRSVAPVGRRRIHRHSADLTRRRKVGCRTAGKHSVGRNGWRTRFGHGEVITTHGRKTPAEVM